MHHHCSKRNPLGLGPRLTYRQGATSKVVQQYNSMATSNEWKHPLAWTATDFTLDDFDLVFLPGGHDKAVSQIIDSSAVRKLLVDYYPKTRKPSHRAIGAVCHGVMVLSNAKGEDGRSVLYGCVTTALPARFEQLAYWGTRAFLGDYYKTYGAGSEDVEVSVSVFVPRTWRLPPVYLHDFVF